ncbi:MAG TPA: hypothetical protein VEV13_03275 [Candidatus Limnocylindria bacterium]|nr:hypothetical protein [Candidatus Limnocylindria bacterium]
MHGRGPRAGLLAVVAVVSLVVGLTRAPVPATAVVSPVGVPALGVPALGVPTATISAFDCDRLEVEITLDNSRSTEGVGYGYAASFQRPLRAPYSGSDDTTWVQVAAGGTRSVVVPVRDDARTVVTVHLPEGGHVVSTGTCGQAPAAAFALADCDTLRLDLILDNGRTSRPTRYRWTLSDSAGPVRSATVDVDAGRVARVGVPLMEGSSSRVAVTVDGKGPVASSDWRSCGVVVLDPRASFGPVDCTDVSAPVVLDNSRSTSRVRFHVTGHADVVLDAGGTRALGLHLPIADRLTATAEGLVVPAATTHLAAASTAGCAATPFDADAASAGSS